MEQITIDPKDFTSSQWIEAYYADGEDLLKVDDIDEAEPVIATVGQAENLALYCRNKAEDVLHGNLHDPDDDDVDEEGWAEDLRRAAEVLEGYVNKAAKV